MCSSVVPAVPCITFVESPFIAAAKCSDNHDFAVPGSPIKSKALSVTSVAMAISTSLSLPMYFGVISMPFTSKFYLA